LFCFVLFSACHPHTSAFRYACSEPVSIRLEMVGPERRAVRRAGLQLSAASTGRGRCPTPGASRRPELSPRCFPPSGTGTLPQAPADGLGGGGQNPHRVLLRAAETSPGPGLFEGVTVRRPHPSLPLGGGGNRDVTKSFSSRCCFSTGRDLGSRAPPDASPEQPGGPTLSGFVFFSPASRAAAFSPLLTPL